jgi:hypothetical protein
MKTVILYTGSINLQVCDWKTHLIPIMVDIYIYIYIAIGNKEVTNYGLLTWKQSDQFNNLILCSMNIYITRIIILHRGVGRLENSTKMYWYFVQKSAVNNRVKNLKICLKNYNNENASCPFWGTIYILVEDITVSVSFACIIFYVH